MKRLILNNEYFNIEHTLKCGQIFRFQPYGKGYIVIATDKACYAYHEGDFAVIECEDGQEDYFTRFFDLRADYALANDRAKRSGYLILEKSAEYGKGIRILRQDYTEALFSFVISQNNNIPRIKGIIERLCSALGEKFIFNDQTFSAFPSCDKMAEQSIEFYKSIGLGYRAEYILELAKQIVNGLNVAQLNDLPTPVLKKALTAIRGVGSKVADCAVLFGFHRGDSFPVDTWIEKVYAQDFCGELKDRAKIADWFVSKFGLDSGLFQQYLFHYKRMVEKSR